MPCYKPRLIVTADNTPQNVQGHTPSNLPGKRLGNSRYKTLAKKTRTTALLCLISVLCLPHTSTIAGQVRDTTPANGLNINIALRHRIIIPEIIYLRVGSPTEISKVKFELQTGFTSGSYQGAYQSPFGSGNEISATENGELEVDVRGNVGDIILSYELSSTSGLSNGNGQFIPFDEIKTTSSDTNLPAPVLKNAGSISSANPETVTITGHLFGNKVVKRQATWTYSYLNTVTPLAGTYEGRVTYTASAP